MSSTSTRSPHWLETTDFKNKKGRVIRPPNKFMIFVSLFGACNKGIGDGRELTAAAAAVWWSLSEGQRNQCQVLADRASERHKLLYPGFNHMKASKEAAEAAGQEKKKKKRNNSKPRKPRSRQTKARSNAYDARPADASSSIDIQAYVEASGLANSNMHFDQQVPSPTNNAPHHDQYSHGMLFDPGFALISDAPNAFVGNQQQIVNHETNSDPQQQPVTRAFQFPTSPSPEDWNYYPPYFPPHAVGPGLPFTSSYGLRDTTQSSAPLPAPFFQSSLADALGPGFVHSNKVEADRFDYTHQSSPFASPSNAPYPTPPSDSVSLVSASPAIDPGSFNDSWLSFDYEQMAASAYPTPSDELGPSFSTGSCPTTVS
ncbi:hypothetical protein BDZ89DRAFT_119721 [Hymenopellis radicata]|nr:hypothetical protein BDZ89DRAFT_119721 [Hymenopellis radicata]